MSNFKIKKELIDIPKIIQVDNIYIGKSKNTYMNNNNNLFLNKSGILYNDSGKLVYRGYDGTVTIIANQ